MFTSILHLARGSRTRSLEVSAPGWLPAAQVLGAAIAAMPAGNGRTAAGASNRLGAPDVARARGDLSARDPDGAPDAVPVTAGGPLWVEHCAHAPLQASADGLPLLPAPVQPRPGTALLRTASGPESGFVIEVPQGEWVVGRGDDHDVCLSDPYLSRQGTTVVNGPGGIDVTHSEMGTTVLEPRESTHPPPPLMEREPLDWPMPTAVTPARPPSWALFVVPIGIGIVLALVIKMWWFLVFSAAGPLTAIITSRLERRRVARETAEARAEHAAEVTKLLGELAHRRTCFENRLRRAATPAGAGVALGTGTCLSPVVVRLPRSRPEGEAAAARLPPHICLGELAYLLCDDVPLFLDAGTEFVIEGGTRTVRGVLRALAARFADAGIACPVLPGMPEVFWPHARVGHLEARVDADESGERMRVSLRMAPCGEGMQPHGGPGPARGGSGGHRSGPRVHIRCSGVAGEALATFPEPAAGRGSGGPGLSARREPPTSGGTPDEFDVRGIPVTGPVHVYAHSAATHIRLLSTRLARQSPERSSGSPPAGFEAGTGHGPGGEQGLGLRSSYDDADGAGQYPPPTSTTELLLLESAWARARRSGSPGVERPESPEIPTRANANAATAGAPEDKGADATGRGSTGQTRTTAGRPDAIGCSTGAGSSLRPVPLGTSMQRPERPGGDTAGRPFAGSRVPGSARGVAALGPMYIDLLSDGPHALVAGTTGSGKSMLLEAWIELLCRTHTPAQLSLILLDFKGGASLGRFARAPHTDALVTDLDEAAARRAVRSIGAEVIRRERLLARHSARDIDDHNRRVMFSAGDSPSADGPPALLPRLLVVIDEFHVLAGLSTEVLAEVERLTALGRSLGIHLILSTQRPAGVVTALMRANISLRICLRVRDETDSQEVLSVPDAAWLSADLPGSALVGDGAGTRAFRCGVPGSGRAETRRYEDLGAEGSDVGHSGTVRIRDLVSGEEISCEIASETSTGPQTRPGEPALPSAHTFGHETPGERTDWRPGPRHRVIAPALPLVLTPETAEAESLPGTTGHRVRAPIALVDLPDENRVQTWQAGADTGTVLITGGRGRGWSTAAETFARAFCLAKETVVHLSPTCASPHVDGSGILRLSSAETWALEFVLGELARRPRPCRLVVDDWDELLRANESSSRLERLERLVTGGTGVRAVVTGQRRLLSQRIAQAAETRVVFPPHNTQDAVYFGLSATRFAGTWPPGRAVVLGGGAPTANPQGADAQIALPAGVLPSTSGTPGYPRTGPSQSSAALPAPHPLWSGFTRHDAPALESRSAASGFGVGVDPCGRAVVWAPGSQGRIMVIRQASGPATKESRTMIALLERRGIRVLTDLSEPDQRAQVDEAACGGTPVCVIAGEQRNGRPAPFDRGNDHGPTLLLGAWRESALRGLGLRDLPAIPANAKAHWWLAEERPLPIRIR